VREDHIHLYGFADAAELEGFRLLTTVQGVGAKVALGILSVLTTDALAQAVAAGDKAAVSQAQGVGPKLATRIVTELKDKVGGIALGAAVLAVATSEPATPAEGAKAAASDAVSALVNLGYGRTEVFGDGWAACISPNPRPIEVWSDQAEWPMALEIRTDESGPTGMMAEEQRCFCRVVSGQQSIPRGATYADAMQVQRWMQQLTDCAQN